MEQLSLEECKIEEANDREKAAAGAKKRGFASMDREFVRQCARKGGQKAHASGRAHQFTPEEAREAGRKGGRAAHRVSKAQP